MTFKDIKPDIVLYCMLLLPFYGCAQNSSNTSELTSSVISEAQQKTSHPQCWINGAGCLDDDPNYIFFVGTGTAKSSSLYVSERKAGRAALINAKKEFATYLGSNIESSISVETSCQKIEEKQTCRSKIEKKVNEKTNAFIRQNSLEVSAKYFNKAEKRVYYRIRIRKELAKDMIKQSAESIGRSL